MSVQGVDARLQRKGVKQGQLKIQISVTKGENLHVTVDEARCMPTSGNQDVFAEVSLVSGQHLESLWTTKAKVQKEQELFFAETCTRLLQPGDEKKRLLISLVKRDHGQTLCLGCMSFGVNHLIAKSLRKSPVCGWYHLLSESLGLRKHLLLDSASVSHETEPLHQDSQSRVQPKPKLSRSSTPNSNKPVRANRKEILGSPQSNMEDTKGTRLTVVVSRCSAGYGFTVKNTCPVRVGRVRTGGAAERAGVQRGDYILQVNGRDVSREAAPVIARLVRNSVTKLVLEINRTRTKKQDCCQHKPHQAKNRSNTHNSQDLSYSEDCDLDENIPPSNEFDSGYATVEHCLEIPRQSVLRRDGSVVRSEVDHTFMTWDPNISAIGSEDSSTRNRHVVSHCSDALSDGTTSSTSSLNVGDRHQRSSMGLSRGLSLTSLSSAERSFPSKLSSTISSTGSWEIPAPADPRARAAAIQRLVQCERDFVRRMQRGIQQFSRPLRHCVLSAQQHATLFQNIEKLVALSEYHLRELTSYRRLYGNGSEMDSSDSSTDSISEDIKISEIYLPRIRLLCTAYHTYLGGLPDAISLLYNLQANNKFVAFIESTETTSNVLADFLEQPHCHLADMMSSISETLASTPNTHDDWLATYRAVNAITSYFQRQ